MQVLLFGTCRNVFSNIFDLQRQTPRIQSTSYRISPCVSVEVNSSTVLPKVLLPQVPRCCHSSPPQRLPSHATLEVMVPRPAPWLLALLNFVFLFFFFFLPHQVACGLLVPRPGIEPRPSAVSTES